MVQNRIYVFLYDGVVMICDRARNKFSLSGQPFYGYVICSFILLMADKLFQCATTLCFWIFVCFFFVQNRKFTYFCLKINFSLFLKPFILVDLQDHIIIRNRKWRDDKKSLTFIIKR